MARYIEEIITNHNGVIVGYEGGKREWGHRKRNGKGGKLEKRIEI